MLATIVLGKPYLHDELRSVMSPANPERRANVRVKTGKPSHGSEGARSTPSPDGRAATATGARITKVQNGHYKLSRSTADLAIRGTLLD